MFKIDLRGEKSGLLICPGDDAEGIFISYMESIYLAKLPAIPVAYFNGPWLPMSMVCEMVLYASSLKYPLEILEIPKRRKSLVDAMLKLKQPKIQPSLFADERTLLEYALDDLYESRQEGKALYSKWRANKNGKTREFSVPNKPLDALLRGYVKDIILQAPCHHQSHGGEPGWSPKKSLAAHLPIGSVLSFDMKDAFKNTTVQYVFDFFYKLAEKKINDEDALRDAAGFLSMISTVYYPDTELCALPVGSSIGMALFNRIMYPLDKILHNQSKKRGLTYTRWVDDFLISSKDQNCRPEKLYGALRVLRGDFPISLNKVFLQQRADNYYLLGHRITEKGIFKADKKELELRGAPVNSVCFANDRELEHGLMMDDNWDDDWCLTEEAQEDTVNPESS